jgi:hypothetical protein
MSKYKALPASYSEEACRLYDEALSLYRQGLSCKEISQRLCVRLPSIYGWVKGHRNPHKASRAFTDEEKQILMKYYPSLPKDKLMALLPGRSWLTIKTIAPRMGLRRQIIASRLGGVKENISETDLAYLAGLIDGEGYVGVRESNNRKRGYQLSPIVEISGTNFPFLLKVREKIGAGHIRTYDSKNRKWKSSVKFQICRLIDIVALLNRLLPYLILKKQQAELLIQFCNSRLKTPLRGNSYSEEEINIFYKLKELNRKGVMHNEREGNSLGRKD